MMRFLEKKIPAFDLGKNFCSTGVPEGEIPERNLKVHWLLDDAAHAGSRFSLGEENKH